MAARQEAVPTGAGQKIYNTPTTPNRVPGVGSGQAQSGETLRKLILELQTSDPGGTLKVQLKALLA